MRAEFLWLLPVRPTFFRQEKQRFFFLFLSGVWSLSDKACAASPRGSEEEKKRQTELPFHINLCCCVWTGSGRKHTGADLRSDCCFAVTFTWAVGGALLFCLVGLQSLRVHGCGVLGDAHRCHLLSYGTGRAGTDTQPKRLVRFLTQQFSPFSSSLN